MMTRLVLLCLAVTWSSVFSLDVKDNSNGFTVSIGGKKLFDHTKESPMLFAGNGDLTVREDSGNYFIHDKLYARLPMYTYNLTQEGQEWRVRLEQGSYFAELRLSSSASSNVVVTVESSSDGLTHFWLRVAAESGEEIYGAGEQFSFVNLRGRGQDARNVFPIWINEQGVGRDKKTQVTFLADTIFDEAGGNYHTTYFAQPTFVSTGNFFFHHHGANYAVLDFSADTFHEIFVYGKPGKFVVSVSDSLVNTVSSLSSYLGTMPLLPDWVQEKIIISLQGGTAVLKEKYALAKKFGIPVSGIWIQDWSGQVHTGFGTRVNWNWKWSPGLYPELDQIIKDWAKEGVRILAYINPNLSNQGDLFKEAASKGYLVKNSTGDVYLRRSITLIFGQVDLTNPEAYDWYKNVIKTNMIGLGLGGWMADFGEYLAVDAVLHDGRKGIDVHNEWPTLWAKLNREAVEEAGKLGEVVFFTRSGFSGSSNYSTLYWNGDQNVDFSLGDGLRSTIYASVGSGMNGVVFNHFDVGGYTTVGQFGLNRTKELLMRYAEYAVFSSVFRCHEGNEIHSNAQWYDKNVTADFAVQARNFAKLSAYRKAVGVSSVARGLATMRLTSLVFPHNPEPVPHDQYMFGEDLLVAPIYLHGATNRSVTFPQLPGTEQWVHIWSGETMEGGKTVIVQAPLGKPAVYFRSGSTHKATFDQLLDSSEGDKDGGKDGGKDGVSDNAVVWNMSVLVTLLCVCVSIVCGRRGC